MKKSRWTLRPSSSSMPIQREALSAILNLSISSRAPLNVLLNQPESAQLLHKPPRQPHAANLCLLHGREERQNQDDEKVSPHSICDGPNLCPIIVGPPRFVQILEEKNIQQGIIVFPGNMTPPARKVCLLLLTQPYIQSQ